jgi:soluble lytic murein transglycosylase-like protein
MEERFQPDIELTRRKALLGAAVLFGAGLLVGGVGVKSMEQPAPAPLSALRPEQGGAEAHLVTEWLPDTVKRWKSQIEKYSLDYEIDPNLTAIIMTIESGGDPNAQSGVATGLMQLTDARATDVAKSFLHQKVDTYDLKDPNTAIEFGVANLRHLIDEFGSSDQGPSWDKTVGLAAAGYYGGEGAAEQYRTKGLTGLTDQGTYNYVRYAVMMWRERHDDKSFTYYFWYNEGNGQALVHNAEKYPTP